MTKKVTWTRDGDQYVGKLGRHEAKITPWMTPLGDAYCHKWGQSNVLKLAKDAVAEKLTALHANDASAQSANRDLSKLFGKPDPRKGEGSTPEESRRNAALYSVR